MAMNTLPPLDPELVLRMLRATLPFSEVSEAERCEMARRCTIDFLPKGNLLLEEGVTPVEDLFLVQKGGVRLFHRSEDGQDALVDFRGEGQSIGGVALFSGDVATVSAETVEDSFLFKFPKDAFLALVERNPVVGKYFLQTFNNGFVSKAFDEMRGRGDAAPGDSGVFLFHERVGALMQGPPVAIEMGKSIRQSARLMVERRIGSLLVYDPSGDYVGIVTDKDLRKTIAVGMDCEAPIETIMSSPVETVESNEVCFDALIRMMTKNIHHLAVTVRGDVAGMITSHDIMVIQGKSPMSLFREISSQNSLDGLPALAKRIPVVVRTLIEEGAKAGNITRMITVLNDLVLNTLMRLLLESFGPPPLPFCWMVMGSEGRREQTFKTDQDNALIIKDTDDEVIARAAEYYFTAFAERATAHLAECGYPLCEGDIMASNTRWRKPYTVWRGYFDTWMNAPEPEPVMRAAIFFDFRCGYGHRGFAEELRNHLVVNAPKNEIFLHYLASNCLETRPPLSFFRNFIVEKDGEHKNRLDIKIRGLAPVADFARVLALRHGVRETSTLDRLDALRSGEFIPDELYTDAREAYEFLMQLRLVHQLQQLERDEPPTNHIDPRTLSDLEKRTLKEAFGVIGKLQAFLKDCFHIGN